MDAVARRSRLLIWGLGALIGFMVLRLINGYGEKPWSVGETEWLKDNEYREPEYVCADLVEAAGYILKASY